MLENDTSAIAVGKRLRYIRQMANLSREDLAQTANVGKTSISYWEHATNETSTMTPRSMAKVMKSIRSAGVICTERWLRNGTGPGPRLIHELKTISPMLIELLPKEIFPVGMDKNISATLSEAVRDEVTHFIALDPSAIVMQVDTTDMCPVFEKDDLIGGVWQPAHTLKTEKSCILFLENSLQIRRVKPGEKDNTFHLHHLTADGKPEGLFEIKDVILDKIAPITRLWR